MTTIVIDDQKKGAHEMLELLQALDFVSSIEMASAASENDILQLKRQKLIKYPKKYDPLALAGAAGDYVLNLAQIRKEWTKMK